MLRRKDISTDLWEAIDAAHLSGGYGTISKQSIILERNIIHKEKPIRQLLILLGDAQCSPQGQTMQISINCQTQKLQLRIYRPQLAC